MSGCSSLQEVKVQVIIDDNWTATLSVFKLCQDSL